MAFFDFSSRKKDSSDLKKGPKKIRQILDEQIDASLHEFNRSGTGLFISAFAAGLEIGFSILLMATVYSLFVDTLTAQALHTLVAFCYPLGFIFVIIGKSELFTEHTALAILPVLNRSVRVVQLLELWVIIYLGNLAGGYIFALIITSLSGKIGFATDESFYHLAHEMTDSSGGTILWSAILAGWLMGLLGWLVTSSQETISRIFIIILVTAVIGIAGLHHCIVGSIEVFSGLIVDDRITLLDYVNFQLFATLGNLIGGVVFVAILKYSHVRAE